MQQKEKPAWISMHIKSPANVTVTTYQALLSLYQTLEGKTNEAVVEEEAGNKEEMERSEADQIFEKIREINFRTIILKVAKHRKRMCI